MKARLAATLAAACLLWAIAGKAQSARLALAPGTATLSGYVFDERIDQPLEGATVTIDAPRREGKAATDAAGRYTFEKISAGIAQPSFQP